MPKTFPSSFYMAYMWFDHCQDWRPITDGPYEFRDMIESVKEAFKNDDCTVDVLRVFFLDGGRYHDMTHGVVMAVNEVKAKNEVRDEVWG